MRSQEIERAKLAKPMGGAQQTEPNTQAEQAESAARIKARRAQQDGNEANESPLPSAKTFWHHAYMALLQRCLPSGWGIQVEKPLSTDRRAGDALIWRRRDCESRDDDAEMMRKLWPLLTDAALLEFKGPTRGYRKREFSQPIMHGWLYLQEPDRLATLPSELTLILVVPRVTATLEADYRDYRVMVELSENGQSDREWFTESDRE